MQGRIVHLNKGVHRDGKALDFDSEVLRQRDLEEGRELLTGDEVQGVVEMVAMMDMLTDCSYRLKDFHRRHGYYRAVRSAYGLLHKVVITQLQKVSQEQDIGILNTVSMNEVYITAKNQQKPDELWAIEKKALELIAKQAIQQCQNTCTKTRKQSKNCALRRALMQVPNAADVAKNNPFVDDEHCIFCQLGGDGIDE